MRNNKSKNFSSNKKEIKFKYNPDNFNQETITWQFNIFDFGHEKWGFKKISRETLVDKILNKMSGLDTMTWGELLKKKKKYHYIPINRICLDAQKRLQELNQNDIDQLFVMHFENKSCLWGIRDGRALKVIWWDPDHQVYPTEPKRS